VENIKKKPLTKTVLKAHIQSCTVSQQYGDDNTHTYKPIQLLIYTFTHLLFIRQRKRPDYIANPAFPLFTQLPFRGTPTAAQAVDKEKYTRKLKIHNYSFIHLLIFCE